MEEEAEEAEGEAEEVAPKEKEAKEKEAVEEAVAEEAEEEAAEEEAEEADLKHQPRLSMILKGNSQQISIKLHQIWHPYNLHLSLNINHPY